MALKDIHRVTIPSPLNDSDLSAAWVVLDMASCRKTGLPGDEIVKRQIKRGTKYKLPKGTVVLLYDRDARGYCITEIMIVNTRLKRCSRLRRKAWFDQESLDKLSRLFRVGKMMGIKVKRYQRSNKEE